MSHPQPNRDANKALFITALGCLLPFHAPGFKGDRTLALNAIGEMIQACRADTPEEYDLAGRSLGYAAAAMDSLRLSMQPHLTDSLILQYRRNAIALGRSADQCRKALQAIRSQPEKQTTPAAATAPMPASRPAPEAPPRPATPPRQVPPTQPHPSSAAASAPSQAPTQPERTARSQPPAHPTSQSPAQCQAQAQPDLTAASQPPCQTQPRSEPRSPARSGRPARSPTAAHAASAPPPAGHRPPNRASAVPPSAYPGSAVIGDPEFTTDLAIMRHNAQAMLADLQAVADDAASSAPEAAIARHAMLHAQPGQAGNVPTP
ncbi:hypothetical protein [Rhodopila sp.]|uniref:hypothetical protein n=1 Tax=Rhodopila sp. TaxID=2480087 RepID=UPI003D0D312F